MRRRLFLVLFLGLTLTGCVAPKPGGLADNNDIGGQIAQIRQLQAMPPDQKLAFFKAPPNIAPDKRRAALQMIDANLALMLSQREAQLQLLGKAGTIGGDIQSSIPRPVSRQGSSDGGYDDAAFRENQRQQEEQYYERTRNNIDGMH